MHNAFALLMVFVGILCLLVAVGFGLNNYVYVSGNGYQPAYASAGAAFGFAISGGSCFLAAALALRAIARQP